MPANKNQIRRIQTILKMMRQNRYPNYSSFIKEMKDQDLAGAYELSSKTFQRDIADLRDEYDFIYLFVIMSVKQIPGINRNVPKTENLNPMIDHLSLAAASEPQQRSAFR